MKLAEAPRTYEALRELSEKENFLDSSPVDLSTYVWERKLADLEEMARSVKLFLAAQRRQLSDQARQGAVNGQNKPFIFKKEEELIWHICRKPGHTTQNCRDEATQGRGCYHCGELTHMRKGCPKLRMNNSKATSSKRKDCAKLRMNNSQATSSKRAASDYGNARMSIRRGCRKSDARYDVRNKEQDRLLQFVSGKRVPAMN